jgi:hypothetical protein
MKRVCIAATVLVLAIGAAVLFDQSNPRALAEDAPIACCNLKVYYDLDYGNGKGGSRSTPLECSRIEFHETYLVLITQKGGGEVIPISHIETFRWEK